MNAAASLTATLGQARIDFTRRFIPEEFTPLYYTREYAGLPEEARLRFNQLYAIYFSEQVIFFEQQLSPALLALQREPLPPELAAGVRDFFEEEQSHTAMFRALNRRCELQLGRSAGFNFVRVPRPLIAALRQISARPRLFPLLLWLALLQEERSLYYSKGCHEHADQLEPHFVAVHRAHLADEIGHVRWDEELLDWLWPRTGRLLRALNSRLLAWSIGEFFHLPKRAGIRVVEQLVRDFPQLDSAALRRAMRGLGADAAYQRTLYSRQITPRAFARFDAVPEFSLLEKTLPGYQLQAA